MSQHVSPAIRDAVEQLAAAAAGWGLALDEGQREAFGRYAAELIRWNERVNLTAIVDPHEIAVRHFLDSLRCALSWGQPPSRVIDVGAGAGFPGLPLKILRPDTALVLVESVEKKAQFLRHVAATLGLADVQVVAARAEALGRDSAHREQYDLALARAVAPMRVLAEYCLPLCAVGGRWLAPKGGGASEELQGAGAAIEQLGGRLVAVEPVLLPGVEPRALAVVDKVAPTPPQYPRAVGIPTKRPL